MPPWSSSERRQQQQQQQQPWPWRSRELVGILEHVIATGSVARAASVRHRGLMSYLHHVTEASRTAAAGATAAPPLAIQSQEDYDRKKRRRGRDCDSNRKDGGDGDGNGGGGGNGASIAGDASALVDTQMEIETTDRIMNVNGIKLVVGSNFTLDEEEDSDSTSTNASTNSKDETAEVGAVPTGGSHSATGVWPTIDLEARRRAEKEATSQRPSNGAAAAAASQFFDTLVSDDTWELEHGDCLGSSKITESESAISAADDDDQAVLASLMDRCWQRAVHTMSSVVPYDRYGALYGPSSTGTSTVTTARGKQNKDALAESSSSLVVRDNNVDEGRKEEEELSTIQSILEREAMFAIDSILHLALTGGKKIAEQRVKKGETTGDDEDTSDNNGDALTWIDMARILSSAAAAAGAASECDDQATVSSHADILQSFARTIQAEAGMTPIALNKESLRSSLSRLSELFDPSLTTYVGGATAGASRAS